MKKLKESSYCQPNYVLSSNGLRPEHIYEIVNDDRWLSLESGKAEVEVKKNKILVLGLERSCLMRKTRMRCYKVINCGERKGGRAYEYGSPPYLSLLMV